MPSSETRQRRPAARRAGPSPGQSEEGLIDLARKLVGLAKEQQRALGIGAKEQFSWAGLRREEVTERLSRILASQPPVSAAEAAELEALRGELLEVDGATSQHMKAQLQELATRQRVFNRNRKSLNAYLSAGPRRGFFDQQR